MTVQQIADRLVELCSKGEFKTAQEELFADDVISIEPYATPDFEKETKGLQAILKKGEKFEGKTEAVHECDAGKPIIAGNVFATVLTMDITMKGQERMKMSELCVYHVKDGKIVSEEFFM